MALFAPRAAGSRSTCCLARPPGPSEQSCFPDQQNLPSTAATRSSFLPGTGPLIEDLSWLLLIHLSSLSRSSSVAALCLSIVTGPPTSLMSSANLIGVHWVHSQSFVKTSVALCLLSEYIIGRVWPINCCPLSLLVQFFFSFSSFVAHTPRPQHPKLDTRILLGQSVNNLPKILPKA